MTQRKRYKLLAGLCIGLLLVSIGAKSQTAADELTTYLVKLFQSPEGQQEIISQLNVPADRQDIYLSYFRNLFSETALIEELAGNIADTVQSTPLEDLESLSPILGEIGLGVAANAAVDGMRRLPTSEMRLLVAHDIAAMEQLPPRLCIAAIDNRLSASEQTAIGINYQNQLSRESLREYLALTRNAIHAHYAGSPMVRSISPSQEGIASETFMQRVLEHPHAELLTEMLAYPDRFSDAENCWAAVEVGWIAVEETGIIGDWLIIWLAQSL